MRKLSVLFTVAVLAAALRPAPASACGGFFCSRPPPPPPMAPPIAPLPIYQSGEKIVFAVDPDGTVTAVVQVAYTGPSQNFAWVVPVNGVPEVSLGAQELVDAVDRATTPTYRVGPPITEGTCATTPTCRYSTPYYGGGGAGGCGFSAAGGGGDRSGGYDAAAADFGGRVDMAAVDSGVTVVSHDQLGPYDIVVLSGVDTLAVARWLDANGYLFPEEARPLLEPYGAAHDTFVAVRLRKDVDTGELVPIVLRYTGEPCIPIRLTAIATVPDMPITAFFLSDVDIASDNYAETELPDASALWTIGGALTYDDVLSNAVDDAGGHAFVREFAGARPALRVTAPDFSGLEADTDPKYFVADVAARWTIASPDVLSSLARSLPPPDGVSASAFFACIGRACTDFDAYLRTVHFDPVATAAALDRDVAAPRRDADAMLRDHPRLTRLATTMSAEEMTVDPTFARVPPHDVSNVHTAVEVSQCSSAYLTGNAPVVLRMPGGSEHPLRSAVPYGGPEAYCAPYGGLASSPPPRSSSSSGFCHCQAPVGTPSVPWLGAGVAALVAVIVRRRRR